jgi:hypothetical protein
MKDTAISQTKAPRTLTVAAVADVVASPSALLGVSETPLPQNVEGKILPAQDYCGVDNRNSTVIEDFSAPENQEQIHAILDEIEDFILEI